MNLLSKKTPWVAASLLAAASVFAQSNGGRQQKMMFDQGHELSQSQMMAAYNAPARIDVRGAWDFYVQGSFTYWQATQENLELGIVSATSVAPTGLNGNVVNMDFEYKPGFKAGLGMNFSPDNWDGLVQYTWYRGTDSVTTTLDPAGTQVVLLPMQTAPNDATASYTNGQQSWRLSMDLLDVELARSEYTGMQLTFRPFIGARAAWIRQRLHASYGDTETGRDSVKTSNSWGLGPRVGMSSNWMIGQGFRFYGLGTGDILFTRYTKLRYNETDSTGTHDVVLSQKDLDTVRTHLELELGIGWGTYFDNNNWHVDVAAGYGFQVFFDQNMFRHFTDGSNSLALANSNSPNGNLYVQGLTATVRFDF